VAKQKCADASGNAAQVVEAVIAAPPTGDHLCPRHCFDKRPGRAERATMRIGASPSERAALMGKTAGFED
jgi:hypothetical protein